MKQHLRPSDPRCRTHKDALLIHQFRPTNRSTHAHVLTARRIATHGVGSPGIGIQNQYLLVITSPGVIST